MSLEEVHKIGIELEEWLRMRGHPIAVKLLKGRDEVPEESIMPMRDLGSRCALCQAWARSRRNGDTVAMFMEDMACPDPVVAFGFAERIPYFLEGHHRYPNNARSLAAAAYWCQNMPHLEYGLYKGVVSAPIGSCAFMPDVILMHINSMMIANLLSVRNWIDGKDIHTQVSGSSVCVYSFVPAFLKRECNVAFPCGGDRGLAFAQDDEIVFALVPEMLSDFAGGLSWFREMDIGIPVRYQYSSEPEMNSGYAELARKIGISDCPSTA